MVQRVAADRLVALASSSTIAYPVRLRVESQLAALVRRLAGAGGGGDAEAAHRALLRRDLERYLQSREWQPEQIQRAIDPPPGSPIGASARAPGSAGQGWCLGAGG